MATFEETFFYPVIILLISTTISLITTPLIIRNTERLKKNAEIKGEITSKMAEAIAQLDAEALFLIYRKKKIRERRRKYFLSECKKWYIDGRSIHSKLEIYCLDEPIVKRWDAYYDLLNNFVNASRMYFDQDPVEHENLQRVSDNIIHHLQHLSNEKIQDLSYGKPKKLENLRTTFDETLWLDIQRVIRRQGDQLIKDVLLLSIKVF